MSDVIDRLKEAHRLGEFDLEGGSPTVESLSCEAMDQWGQDVDDADSFAAGYQQALYELRGMFAQPSSGAQGNAPEPVAWTYEFKGDVLGPQIEFESKVLKEFREGETRPGYHRIEPRSSYINWQPLYRQPPAPAPVMPRLEMADVVRAHMEIPFCPILTSNQCHTLAMKLNACLDRVKELNKCKKP